MKKTLIILLIVLGITLSANDEVVKTSKAHDFKLKNLKGKNIRLSDVYKEKLVILDFWASWCIPCKKEMPHLDALQKKYDKYIQVIAVDIDKARHIPKAKTYVKSKKFSFETLFDTDQKIMKLYNVQNPPNTFIIDKNGEIVWSHLGYTNGDEKEIEAQIIKLIEIDKNDSLQTEINGEAE